MISRAGALAATAPKLVVGADAPGFRTVDLNGAPVSLAGFRGHKLLLSFHRFASCPFCNLHVHDMIERYPTWRRQGLAVVALFESPAAGMQKFVGTQTPPFSLVADPDRAIYASYGVTDSGNAILGATAHLGDLLRAAGAGLFKLGPEDGDAGLYPAEFLIDEQSRVRLAHYGANLDDHLPLDEVDQFAAQKATPGP